jgi:hypothetical protein
VVFEVASRLTELDSDFIKCIALYEEEAQGLTLAFGQPLKDSLFAALNRAPMKNLPPASAGWRHRD